MQLALAFLSALPYLCLPATVWLLWLARPDKDSTLFQAAINGALVWSSLIWLQANLLSLFNAIYPLPIAIFWIAYGSALIWMLRGQKLRFRLKWPANRLLATIYLVVILTLLTALIYPPAYWDVLAYHLPRVMQWLQNHTLAPYWTPTVRQIGMPPFNAMIAMQSLAAGADDYFVNLGQWLAFVGCIIGVSHITAQLGGSRRAQLFAAFLMAVMPSAIMQASNTESTDIVTFWLLAFASLSLDWFSSPSWRKASLIGLCLGFAILSKGSAYPVALPFVILIALYCLVQPRRRFAQGAIMALLIIALNLPHLQRTYTAYGSIVGGTETNILRKPTPATFAVNAIYNFLVHEPFLLKNGGARIWQGIANALGVDESDPEIFPWKGLDNAWKRYKPLDAYGQNSLYALLLLALAIAVILRKFRPPTCYSVLVLGSFAAYCLFLTWHPWTGRIHTSLFALAMPLCGMFLDTWQSFRLRMAVMALACVSAVYVFYNGERPLFSIWNDDYSIAFHSREGLYIAYRDMEKPYMQALEYLASQKPESVALVLTDDAFEYPVWAYLYRHLKKRPEIFHLGRNQKAGDEAPEFIWVQNLGSDGKPLADPYILKRNGSAYKVVFGVSD